MKKWLYLICFFSFGLLFGQEQKSETKKYAKKTYRFTGETVKNGKFNLDSISVSPLTIARIWDETDTLSGFVHSLGIIGKPVSVWKYGLPIQFFQTDVMENPWNRNYEPYMRYYSHETTWFFDTRLPYSQLKFAQPGQKIQLLGIEIAQNISPFSSIGGSYQRRTGIGAYLNQVTDHWIFALQSQAHTKNKKLWLLLSADFQQFSDQMNGGTFQDSSSSPKTSFEKFAQLVTLKNAISVRKTKGFRTDAVAWVIGKPDSSLFKLNVFTGIDFRYFLQQYHDDAIENTAFLSTLNKPYPVLFSDSSQISTFIEMEQLEFHLGSAFQFKSWVGKIEAFGQKNHLKPDSLPSFTNTGFKAQIQTTILGLEWKYNGFFKSNILFKPEFQHAVQINKKWLEREEILEDTLRNKQGKLKKVEFKRTYIPLETGFSYTGGSRQPSLQSAYFQSNTFIPLQQSLLQNSNYHLFKAFLKKNNPTAVKNLLPFLANNYTFSAFFSQCTAQLPDSFALQTKESPALSCAGIDWLVRLRLGRFYLESHQTIQKYLKSSGNWGKHVPNWYGKMAVFYENHFFKKAAIGRIGMDLNYRGSFYPVQYSPDVSVFYAQSSIKEKANLWIDLHLSMQVKWATFFIKASNILDKVLSPGYYSTLYYPMLHRNISFGIQWIFWE